MSLWVRIKGAEDADDYYWNPESQKVEWQAPEGVEVEWAAQPDSTGRYYYWNQRTRETTWEVPSPSSGLPAGQRQNGAAEREVLQQPVQQQQPPQQQPPQQQPQLQPQQQLQQQQPRPASQPQHHQQQLHQSGQRHPTAAAPAAARAPLAGGAAAGRVGGDRDEPVPGERFLHTGGGAPVPAGTQPHAAAAATAAAAAGAAAAADAVQKWPFYVSEEHSSLKGPMPAPSQCGSRGGQAPASEADPQNPFGVQADAAWVMVERPPPSGGAYYWNFLRRVAQNALPQGERPRWRAHHLPAEEGEEDHSNGAAGPGRPEVFFEHLETGQRFWQIPDIPPALITRPRQEHLEGFGGCRLEPNLAVMVQGLERPADRRYNGQVGSVLCFQDGGAAGAAGGGAGGRALVQLPDALGGTVLTLAPRNVTPLPRPHPVELQGLTQAALNGQVGTVESFLPSDGPGKAQRYLVRLPDGSVKSVPATKVVARSRIWNLSFETQHRDLQMNQEQKVAFIDSKGNHNYVWVRLPSDFWTAQTFASHSSASRGGEEAWPLLVWLPGAGGGSFFAQNKKNIRLAGLQLAATTFVVVTPECQWKWTSMPEPWVHELVESLRAADWVDHRRVYLSGCSMGGMGTWELGHQRPDLYAALAPVAAHHKEERERKIAAELRGKPIFVVHSSADETCLRSREESLWNLLLQEGNRRLQVNLSADLDHTSMFRSAYAVDTTLYDWLLQFQLEE